MERYHGILRVEEVGSGRLSRMGGEQICRCRGGCADASSRMRRLCDVGGGVSELVGLADVLGDGVNLGCIGGDGVALWRCRYAWGRWTMGSSMANEVVAWGNYWMRACCRWA